MLVSLTRQSITTQKLRCCNFGELQIVLSPLVNLITTPHLLPPPLNVSEVLSFAFDEAKLVAKIFSENFYLDDLGISLPAFPYSTDLNLTYETLWAGAGSGLLISVLGKHDLLHFIVQITLVLLLWRRMYPSMIKKPSFGMIGLSFTSKFKRGSCIVIAKTTTKKIEASFFWGCALFL